MLAGEAVKTFPLSLVMISSSISFLAGVLSFSRIRNLQSLCRRSSLWTFVVQAGEQRSRPREREEMSRRGRRRKRRAGRERERSAGTSAGLLLSPTVVTKKPPRDQRHPPLPGWAWPSEVNARSAGRLTFEAASPPGRYRIFSERATVPLSGRHFFN